MFLLVFTSFFFITTLTVANYKELVELYERHESKVRNKIIKNKSL